ncbi:MAG: Type II secretion system protein E [Parcubacteria group bacterium Greene0714_21]|nr:MAG: Type II secretion system protein E [Parcubacteria group bacterium Greene0416_39]TSC98164.1 MAG: Type II secretion system protein E [Parcubacteria group bacterium Greene1014_47]TSD04035.1 MAG: Type II secretion system protein E [Parcubacteria group bacterium Greene0714_21]
MHIESEQLQAFLLDANLVPKGKLEGAVKSALKAKKRLRDVLLEQNLLTEETLLRMEAYILGIPFVDLEKEKIDPTVLKIIPEPIAKSHNIVAFRSKEQDLEVAMLDPDDLATIDFIRKKSNLKILPRLTTTASIKQVLRQYSKSLEAEFGELIQKDAVGIKVVKEDEAQKKEGKEDLKKVAEELPVIRIVDTLMRHAILQRASDIHIEPTEKEVVVRYRIDGILRDAMVLPKAASSGIVARIKVLSDLQLDEHRLPQDGRFKVETDEYRYSLRVSILPVFDGEKIVMRLLSESANAFTLEQLGFRGEALEHIQKSLRKPVGMILVTGPTGCGKTTTLYSMMEILNTPQVNISTVEDPIEYRMPRVNQTQVNSKVGLTFASGLRSLLRQDPDILMVGEIRDKETADLAINSALTGHLVLSTLHTNSAAGSLPRLVDMGAEPFLISSTLSVIVGQRLVRRLLEEKEPYKLTTKELARLTPYCNVEKITRILQEQKLLSPKGRLQDVEFFKPKPTKDFPDGYKGRVGIYEVLPITESIKQLLVQKATSDQIQEQAEKEGMLTMVDDGFIKAVQGLTTIEEVLRVITE